MAFSFGTSTFGAASAPAFGSTPAPAFGAQSQPASAFGAAPAASTPSLFGATTAPAFGATTASAPAFGAPATAAPAASPFGAPAAAQPAASPFGGGTGLFGAPAANTSTALVPFGQQQQQQQQQQQLQQQQQARPAGLNYKTKFEELPPQMQQELQKIQQEISSYRHECKALDNDTRLHDNVGIKQSLDQETAALRQTLQSLYQASVADEEGLMTFREAVMVLLRSTEAAIRLYQRSRLWRDISQAAGSTGAAAQQQQQLVSQAMQDAILQPVQLPNPYLQLAVREFAASLEQYHRCISELERVVGPSALLRGPHGAEELVAVQSLPTLVSHMHDYFVHVAARLEKLHGEVARAREAYLAQRRAVGDLSDPFAEARPLHHVGTGPGRPGGHGGWGGSLGSSFGRIGGGAAATGGGAAGSSQPAAAAAPSTTTGAAAPGTPSGGFFGGFGALPPASPPAFGTPLGGTMQQATATRAGSSAKKR